MTEREVTCPSCWQRVGADEDGHPTPHDRRSSFGTYPYRWVPCSRGETPARRR